MPRRPPSRVRTCETRCASHRPAAHLPLPDCSGEGPRGRLEFALRRLPAWASPYLYGLVRPIDARFRARTLADPLASPDLPWWEQRRSFDHPVTSCPPPQVRP
ncbi:hypothetical protein ACIBG7_20890 [Nonomuraea sp. NPDC050328]|uniref:hypothetical protein n=1 Tax=Nonomuraea sp. NPDC050328 TaxID=3364361 RepID=UPI0037A99CE6